MFHLRPDAAILQGLAAHGLLHPVLVLRGGEPRDLLRHQPPLPGGLPAAGQEAGARPGQEAAHPQQEDGGDLRPGAAGHQHSHQHSR